MRIHLNRFASIVNKGDYYNNKGLDLAPLCPLFNRETLNVRNLSDMDEGLEVQFLFFKLNGLTFMGNNFIISFCLPIPCAQLLKKRLCFVAANCFFL